MRAAVVSILCAVVAAPTLAAAARTSSPPRPVPVLMYHVVADPPASAPYPDLYVSRAEFEAQMRWLESRGYRTVALADVLDAWREGRRLPPRAIVLTFDDGYRSHFSTVRPVLRRHGFRATLNLDLSNLQESWGLRPWMVQKLVRAGWELGAHSLTHPDLTTLDNRALRREVAGSRAEIRRLFGVSARLFCYPSGSYDRRVVAAVARAGFEGATTVEPGLATGEAPFELRRIRIDRGDGARVLAAKLSQFGLQTGLTAVHGGLGSR